MGKNQVVYKTAWFQLETTINCIIVSSTLLLAIPLYTMHHPDLLQGNRVLTPTPASNNSSMSIIYEQTSEESKSADSLRAGCIQNLVQS